MNNDISNARDHWQQGSALEAGRLIFDSLPIERHPGWATAILVAILDRTQITCDAVQRLLEVAKSPTDWGKAHQVFDQLRRVTIMMERSTKRDYRQNLLLKVLYLAELVAKVIYNSTNPEDEFDEDSGWWIAPCLQDVLDFVNDDSFSAKMWLVLSSQEGE